MALQPQYPYNFGEGKVIILTKDTVIINYRVAVELQIITSSSFMCKIKNTKCVMVNKKVTQLVLLHGSYPSVPGDGYKRIVGNSPKLYSPYATKPVRQCKWAVFICKSKMK
jgi:hypothetical protein